MAQTREIVYDAVTEFGGTCPLEGVTVLCPELTGAQVCLAIDAMNRSGELRLVRDRQGTYFVRTC